MATSGTSDFNATRNEICREAARMVQAIRGVQATMHPNMLQEFTFALNAMTKTWQAAGIHVWTVSEATLFPQPGQIRYSLKSSSTDHATQEYAQSSISADEAVGQTILSVTDTSDFAVNDYCGVILNDGTIQWSTVQAKSSTTVTIVAPLTDTASEGNPIFAYTTKIVRPLKVVDARTHDIASEREIPIDVVSRLDYRNLPNKTVPGRMNQVFYDPQLTVGYANIWMVEPSVTELLNFTWWRPIQDFSAAGDNPDLPQEWIETLIFNLALAKCPAYQVSGEQFAMIKDGAENRLDMLSGFDRENESIIFGVDRS